MARMRSTRAGLLATLAGVLALTAEPLCAAAPDGTASRASDLAVEPAHGHPVTIKRDEYGVPHVYASSVRGLFRGYGYAVAQDRLFQMEMSRRSTQGTVSEVLGPDYLAFDRDTRTGFDAGAIMAQIAALPSKDRDILEGYAAGMNEYLALVRADKARLLPKEFLDYGFEPADWSAYDVAMVWVGTMANRYSDSTAEIPNYLLLQELIAAKGSELGRVLFDQLQWIEDPLAPTTAPRSSRSAGTRAAGDASAPVVALAPLTAGVRDAGVELMRRAGAEPNAYPTASNIWIIGRQRTEGAKSILYNGPQFEWFNPSYVYGIGLHGAGWDFAGTTPFSYPAVIFGTNNEISWGATAGALNLVDIYQERLNPANPRQYWYNGDWRDMDVRAETITVKGEADVVHEVLSTVHGAVTSVDLANNRAYSKKRSWTGHEVRSLIAWAKVPTVKSFAEFKALAAQFATTINWYYADKRGNIGYIAPGRLPKRPANQDVRIPAIGDGSMEWEGYLPASANPMTYNPEQGFITNWNNQPAAGFNNDFGNWSVVDRVKEINAAFEERSTWTAADAVALNRRTSFVDLNARYVAPTLAAAVAGRPPSDPTRQDVELVTEWNGLTRDGDSDGFYDGPQPAIMRAWLPILFDRVLTDDLPPAVVARYAAAIYPSGVEQRGSIRPAAAMKLVYNGILGPDAGVPQTVDVFDGEDPRVVLLETYEEALASLRATHGADMDGWTVPIATHLFSFRNFLRVPQTTPDQAIPGPQYMNRGTANILAVLGKGKDRLCISAPPGQSGFIAADGTKSPNYADQLDLWADFECREEHLTRREVSEHTVSATILR